VGTRLDGGAAASGGRSMTRLVAAPSMAKGCSGQATVSETSHGGVTSSVVDSAT
jgi:hypothetical protein